jgi:hypothetical protein
LTNETIQDELRSALRRLGYATVVLYVVLSLLGLVFYVSSTHRRDEIAAVAASTNTALCALRSDLERRVASSIAFLEDNPEGFPGIPAQTIRDSIANQERTITALAVLTCPIEP